MRRKLFSWHCFTHFPKTTAPQHVILSGKLSTIIIFKLCKFSVNLWTLCFLSYKSYNDPLKTKSLQGWSVSGTPRWAQPSCFPPSLIQGCLLRCQSQFLVWVSVRRPHGGNKESSNEGGWVLSSPDPAHQGTSLFFFPVNSTIQFEFESTFISYYFSRNIAYIIIIKTHHS